MKRIGLVINPIAGIGGRVGLKGSDGRGIQSRALKLGAVPGATGRAVLALRSILPYAAEFELFTWAGEMGDTAVHLAGLDAHILGKINSSRTSAADTIRAAKVLKDVPVDLLLFAGGDGTARDIHAAIGSELPAIGIPAGVKIQSAVFAKRPDQAGLLAAAFLHGETELRMAEVIDLDENAYRIGRVSPRLYGYLQVPYAKHYLQGGKNPSPPSELEALHGIAKDILERMQPGWLYVFGPGSTTHSVAATLGLEKTLLGVDVVLDGRVIAFDVGAAGLLELLDEYPDCEIFVTPIGGQGCIFGRGNQQISPEVIRKVGRERIRIISTTEKIQTLRGQPLWADTGDAQVDDLLGGYMQVITGYKEIAIYKVSA